MWTFLESISVKNKSEQNIAYVYDTDMLFAYAVFISCTQNE